MTKRAVEKLENIPKYRTIAHDFLDLEREAGFEVTPSAYQTLDGILYEAQQRINTQPAYSKPEAVKNLKTIDQIFREKGFKQGDMVCLSQGLKEEKPRPINCLGRTAIYKAIGDALNLPLAYVSVPEHVFVRWHLENGYINWETTAGKEKRDYYYVVSLNIPNKAIEEGIFLKSMIENESLLGNYHTQLGYVLRRQKNFRRALEHHLKSVELDPLYQEGFNNIGVILMYLGKDMQALSYFTRALQLNPNSAHVHTNCGILYFHQGDFGKAARSFMKALELAPDHENAKKGLELATRKL